MRFGSATWALLAAALLSAGAAPADPVETSPSDWLEWLPVGDAGACPGAEVFAAKVERHLGRSPAQAAAESRRRLVARIEREASNPSQWLADVKVLDPAGGVVGSRTMAKTSDTCGPVADALALVAALVLSQQALAEPDTKPESPTVASPPPAPSVETTLKVPARAANAPAGAPNRAHGWALAVDGGPSFGLGILPGLNLGGEIRFLVVPPAWPSLYVRSSLWPQAKANTSAGHGATLDLWTVGLGLCPLYAHSSPWTFDLCVGGDTGRLRARGFGFATKTSGEQWLVELAAGGDVQRWLVGGFSAAVGLDFVVPLTNGRVAYAGTTGESVEFWRRWPVGAVGSARLGYAFW